MIQRDGSDSFLLPMTLAEVSILLFFLLLFAAVSQIRKVESEARRSSVEAEKLQKRVEQSRARIEKLRQRVSEVEGLSKNQAKKLMEKSGREEKIKKLREKISSLENQARGLDSLAALKRQDDDEFEELVREASQNLGREKKISRLTERLERARAAADSMGTALDSVENALGDYRAQSINLSRRLQEAGQGYPPCWADKEGEPQYLYTVRLLGDSLKVRPNWPSSREDNAQRIDGALALAGRTVSEASFAKLSAPVLSWSKRQDPECRHFVVVEDSEGTTKQEFKSELLLVERFFYKYIRRGT